MDFVRVEINNFLTIKSAKIELAGRGLILIQGVNMDDTSAKSNGAGKSSLVDALCWCLYGETAREESGDGVVHNKAKKDCFVVVTIKDGDNYYEIRRHRKHSTEKNSLHVLMSKGCPPSEALPTDILALHKGTEGETQEVINKIMGCTLDVFMGAIYAGQERMPNLPGLTDKFLKILIEEAAGTEVLATAYELAKKKANAVQDEVDGLSRVVNTHATNLENVKSQIADAIEQSDKFEAERPSVIANIEANVSGLAAELMAKKRAVDAIDLPAIDAELAIIQKSIDDQAKFVADANSAEAQLVATDKALSGMNATLVRLGIDVKDAANRYKGIAEKVGKPCSECGKEYEEADLVTAQSLAKKKLVEIKAEYDAQVNLVTIKTNLVAELRDKTLKLKALIPDISALSARKLSLGTSKADRNFLVARMNDIATSYKTWKAELEAAKTAENPHAAHLTALESRKTATEKDYATAKANLEAGLQKLQMRKDVVSVYSPAGVRAHILDTVTPFLNDVTKEYLGALSDGSIHATWSTMSKTAKGELRERFAIDVINTKGGETFKSLSGGEKRKVRLACALALQDLQASRATKPINLFIGDEIDDALDEAGLERLMGILERKARERGTVLVISHNSLRDWIDQVIVITKKDKESTVSGAVGAEEEVEW